MPNKINIWFELNLVSIAMRDYKIRSIGEVLLSSPNTLTLNTYFYWLRECMYMYVG